MPVRSVVEYFEHYGALEIDFTSYSYLLDTKGDPGRNYLPLVEYGKWLPADALIILKVPEAICSPKRWDFEGGKRARREPRLSRPRQVYIAIL